jgi:hypothetical protein
MHMCCKRASSYLVIIKCKPKDGKLIIIWRVQLSDCNAVYFGDSLIIWRNMACPSSGYKDKTCKKPAEACSKLRLLSLDYMALQPISLHASKSLSWKHDYHLFLFANSFHWCCLSVLTPLSACTMITSSAYSRIIKAGRKEWEAIVSLPEHL